MNTDVPPAVLVAVLERATELLERGWTQGTYARDEHGYVVAYDDDAAVCWCADGAIRRAMFEQQVARTINRRYVGVQIEDLILNANRIRRYHDIVPWNDAARRRKAEVLRAFRTATDAARALEQAA